MVREKEERRGSGNWLFYKYQFSQEITGQYLKKARTKGSKYKSNNRNETKNIPNYHQVLRHSKATIVETVINSQNRKGSVSTDSSVYGNLVYGKGGISNYRGKK